MSSEPSRFVPKVHPATRPMEAEDPLSLHAVSVEGDPEVMLHCVVQEYAWMGWGSEEILSLFRDPFYPVLRELWERYGEAILRERIAALIQETGIFHFQVAIREAPEPEPASGTGFPARPGRAGKPVPLAEPELVELGIPVRWRAKGSDHA